ncbi:hypothetical protein J3E72DRAFT_387079 [Bipolaris maydis]|nr:hypothetical protein J3E72DRAFT_387079 [Bipolaris maydis]
MPTKPVKDSDRQRCLRACANCARRKEKCSGQVPCTRCLQRRVAASCRMFTGEAVVPAATSCSRSRSRSHTPPQNRRKRSNSSSNSTNSDTSNSNSNRKRIGVGVDLQQDGEPPLPLSPATSHTHATGPSDARRDTNYTRTLRSAAGELIYLGDTADSTLLQDIRRLAQDVVGDCDLVNNPLQHDMSDPIPQGPARWMDYLTQEGPPKPSLDEAKSLIKNFLWVTTSFLNLFDEKDLVQPLAAWTTAPVGCKQHLDQDTIYFLIFAIAAQADPTDKDSLADKYFAYGRYLVACHYSEEPSVTAVQSYMLIATFLLAAARRDAAFMYTGLAARAAYALGIHHDDVAASFPTHQQRIRHKLWKAVHVLDGYISVTLGRKPASRQTYEAIVSNYYSSCSALCRIFQEIVDVVYSAQLVSSDTLQKISNYQREWTTRLREGLKHDEIPVTDFIGTSGHKRLNLSLLFIKSGYYWSIILLSRPFLVDFASSVASAAETSSVPASPPPPAANLMISACVASAIHLIELFQKLTSVKRLPKRLPFVVNLVHTASLVLALSVFLDFDRQVRISRYLEAARSILVLFRTHDPLANCNVIINERLQQCCNSYIEKREQKSFDRQGQLVASYFGSLEEPETLNIDAASFPFPKGEESSTISDLFGSDYDFVVSNDPTISLLDAPQFSIGDQKAQSAPTIAPDPYDLLFPPGDSLFTSHGTSFPPLVTFDTLDTLIDIAYTAHQFPRE